MTLCGEPSASRNRRTRHDGGGQAGQREGTLARLLELSTVEEPGLVITGAEPA